MDNKKIKDIENKIKNNNYDLNDVKFLLKTLKELRRKNKKLCKDMGKPPCTICKHGETRSECHKRWKKYKDSCLDYDFEST